MALRVLLDDGPVGRLEIDSRRECVVFRFDEAWLERPDRPVLGRYFEDFELDATREFVGFRTYPHNFFRNCLPEGVLRRIVDEEVPQATYREYVLLGRLGEDLPGGLRITPDDIEAEPSAGAMAPGNLEPGRFRFSFTGAQPKVPVRLGIDDRATFPVHGQGAHWIAKLESDGLPRLPENEFLVLSWARSCGLATPEFQIRPAAEIENLPVELGDARGMALLVRRFDRDGERGRTHQEDFAQVFNVAPEAKYFDEGAPDDVNHATIGAVVRAACGRDDFHEYIRRVVFMLLSGNRDGHAKNWALIYPDGRRPRLAPCYDLVSTIAYPRVRARLALNLYTESDPFEALALRPQDITIRDLVRMARQAGEDERVAEEIIRTFSARARSIWRGLPEACGAPEQVVAAIEENLRTLAV